MNYASSTMKGMKIPHKGLLEEKLLLLFIELIKKDHISKFPVK